MEELLNFVMVKLYPHAHFFLDEIPVMGKAHQKFQGIKIKRKAQLKKE